MPTIENIYVEGVPTLCAHAAKVINQMSNGEQHSAESRAKRESQLENRELNAALKNWIRPHLPSRCTWRLGTDVSESPHSHQTWYDSFE